MKNDFETKLQNIDNTLDKIHDILEKMLLKAETEEDYELCQKIYCYQKMAMPKTVTTQLIKPE